MSPEEYGRISLFLSMQFIAVPLISFSADGIFAVNKSKLHSSEYEKFKNSYITFSYLMFILIQILFFLLYLANFFHDKLLLLIPFVGIIRFLIGMASTEFIMEEKSVKYGMIAFFSTLTSLTLTVIALNIFSGVADWRVFSLLLADILFLLIRYRGQLKILWTFSFDIKIFKKIILFGYPLLLSVPPAWALNESDKFIVSRYLNMTSLGQYAAACAIGGIMITFNTAMLNSFMPKIYFALSNRSFTMLEVVKQYIVKFFAITIIFGACFIFFYWLVADLILPEKYIAAREIVYVVIIFSLGRALYSVLGLVADFYGMTMVKFRGIMYGGLAAMIFTLIGVLKIGVIGAAVGVGSGYFVLSYVLWIALREKTEKF